MNKRKWPPKVRISLIELCGFFIYCVFTGKIIVIKHMYLVKTILCFYLCASCLTVLVLILFVFQLVSTKPYIRKRAVLLMYKIFLKVLRTSERSSCVFFWQHLMADVYTFMTDFYDKYFVLVLKAWQRSSIW